MKVLGGIVILLATLVGPGSYDSHHAASTLRDEVASEGGFTRFVGAATGLGDLDEARIQSMEDQARNLGISAGVLGILGLVFWSSAGKKS